MLHRELVEVDLVHDGDSIRFKGTHEYLQLNLATVATGREVQVTFEAPHYRQDEPSYLLRRTRAPHTGRAATNNDWHVRRLSWEQNSQQYNELGLQIAEPSLSADAHLDFLNPSQTVLAHGSEVYMNILDTDIPVYVGRVAGIEMVPYLPPTQTTALRRPSVTPWRGQFAQTAA